VSALKFKIERPEDKIRKKLIKQYVTYGVLGLIVVLAVWGLFWYVLLDRIPPEITLKSPVDGFVTNTASVDLDYDVEDSSDVKCEILLNGVVVEKTATLNPGDNSWKVKCTDEGYYELSSDSDEWKIHLLTPLKFEKINLIEAPELKKGVLRIYENSNKNDVGRLLFEILPLNAGLIAHNESTGKHLSISVWGKDELLQQQIEINNLVVKLPKITNITGDFVLYVDSAGNTYHSYSSHNYNTSKTGNKFDLNWNEAISLEHRANN